MSYSTSEYMRNWSKARYQRLKGTPGFELVYPKKPIADRFATPFSRYTYLERQRILKRVERFKKGAMVEGVTVRCDCGKTVKTCIRSEEMTTFRDNISMCKFHG